MIAHIDGDFLRYLGGSSLVERRWYEVEGVSSPPFHYKRDILEYCKENEIEGEIIQRQEVIDEDLLYELIDQSIDRILYDTGSTEYKMFIEGKDNFRAKLFPEYKSNRKGTLKPLLAAEAKQYLIDVYGAELSHSMEADDYVAMSYNKDGGILCSNDKDLLQVPGLHYNPQSRAKTTITELEGLRNLYTQVLMGDAGDAIPGVKGIGPRRAETHMRTLTEAKEMWDKCVELHESDESANLTASLVYILRHDGDFWCPPV